MTDRRSIHRRTAALTANILRKLSFCILPLSISACSSTPSQETTPSSLAPQSSSTNLPSLKEIRNKPNYDELPQIFTPDPDLVQLAQVNRLTLPYARSLDNAWDIVDESTIPPIAQAMWHNNGLRLGLIPKSQITTFLDKLPAVLNNKNTEIAATTYPLPIRTSRRIEQTTTVDLTVPPYTAQTEQITNGQVQLLAQLVDQNNKTSIKLTPHHYLPKTTLEEQIQAIRRLYRNNQSPTFYTDNNLTNQNLALPTPLETALDGKVYNDLALTVHVPESHYLVVGLYWPWTYEIQYAEHFAKQLEQKRKEQALYEAVQQAKLQAEETGSQPLNLPQSIDDIDLGPIDTLDELPPDANVPFLPPHPGRALFASTRGDVQTQIILIINVTNPDIPINLPKDPTYQVNQTLPTIPTRTIKNNTIKKTDTKTLPHPTLSPQPYTNTAPRYRLNATLPKLPHQRANEKTNTNPYNPLIPPHPQQQN